MQRDRAFESYQDLEASYGRRPGYFVEPEGDWGEGAVTLMELPTDTEVNDNIVAYWRPKQPYPAGEPVRMSYRVRARSSNTRLHPGGYVANTFLAATSASGAAKGEEAKGTLSRRFLIDFAGGELPYYLSDPSKVEVGSRSFTGTDHRHFAHSEPAYRRIAGSDRHHPRRGGPIYRSPRLPAR